MVDRLVDYSKTKIMKKLILYISIIFFSIISYSQEAVRPLVNADLLEGKGAAHFIDTTSFLLDIIDISKITIDTLAFDYGDITNDLDVGDTIEFDNGFQIYNTHADTGYLKEAVIKIEGDLVVTGNVESAAAGGICFVSTPGTQTINTGGTFERLNEGSIAYTGDHLYKFTHDDGRLTYTGTHNIHITLTVAMAIESGEVAQVTNFRIAKNGTTIAYTQMPITLTALDEAANTPLKWLDNAVTDDYWEIFGTSDTDADEFDVTTLVFTITKH